MTFFVVCLNKNTHKALAMTRHSTKAEADQASKGIATSVWIKPQVIEATSHDDAAKKYKSTEEKDG